MRQPDLFAAADPPDRLELAEGAVLLRGLAASLTAPLLAAVDAVAAVAPFRQMTTPGGRQMSVAMSNCGTWGWISDHRGYRYVAIDPETGRRWPAMPAVMVALAGQAAAIAGFPGFVPDACLINRYQLGAKLSLHRDADEDDFSWPIVSVSLGLPAVFLWGEAARGGRPRRLPLAHGDVLVWGGPARLTYHGVLPLAAGMHPATGCCRINLTLRRAR
jgi:alkylated DNA repair protein (DNA oxidative demethylase)